MLIYYTEQGASKADGCVVLKVGLSLLPTNNQLSLHCRETKSFFPTGRSLMLCSITEIY